MAGTGQLAATRRSDVVYIVVRLALHGQDYFLFRKHTSWGDWSLIGGHVEPEEQRDWSVAATRETEEELEPLRVGFDVRVSSLVPDEICWGPEPSRSSDNQPTYYKSRWYWLEFLRDPHECLRRLNPEDFILVPKDDLHSHEGLVATNLIKRLENEITYGLDSIPYAWPSRESPTDLSIPVLGQRNGEFYPKGTTASLRR